MTWSFFGGKEQRKQKKSRRQHHKLTPGRRRPHFEVLEDRRVLAVLTVNTPSGAAIDHADGLLSLREALDVVANGSTGALVGAEVGQVDATTSPLGTNDTIAFKSTVFPVGTIMSLTGGELGITDSVTINGPGAGNLAINGTGASRIFNITDAVGDVTLKGMTLTNGNPGAFHGGAISSNALGLLSISDSVITGNASNAGGAIYSDGDLSLTNTTVGGIGALKNTSANGGGGIFTYHNVTLKNSTISGNTAGAAGGGILSYGVVSLENSTIGGSAVGAGNTAVTVGGGIYGQTINLLNSTVTGNSATTKGGGIYSTGGMVTVKLSTVSGNQSGGRGGGIYNSGIVSLDSSIIGGTTIAAANKAANQGGGIWADTVNAVGSTIANNQSTGASAQGGGIYANTMTLRNTTIASNLADLSGGGIAGKTITVQNSTIANNVADNDNNGSGGGGGIVAITTLKMTNSIVIGNSDTGGTAPEMVVGATRNVRFSLIGDNTGLPADAQFTATGPAGAANANGNRVGAPGPNVIAASLVIDTVGGLKDNGGPTPTIALLAGSLAMDKGKNSLVVSPSTGDQRGLPFVRTFNANVDMGAFEFQTVALNAAPTVANVIPDQTAVVGSPFVFTFAANTFNDTDGDTLTYTATLSPVGALPAWLTFTQGTGGRTFVGVPAVGDIGAITIRVTASDGKGGIISDDFVLTVTSNPPPTLATPLLDQIATVTVPFNYVVPANAFTDPNSDPLTYTATLTGGGALPAWLTFNPTTRAFTGTPAIGDVGTINVRVTATDPTGGSAFDDFAIVVSTSELPFHESFESLVDARIVQQSPSFATTTASPISGTTSYQATRPTVGSHPVATVNFASPTTVPNITNVSVNVSTLPGNGSSLWSNAVVVFDYQSPTNYKFAGVFEIINKLIIGEVVNGKVKYLVQKKFNAAPNTTIPLNVAINQATKQVTLSSGGTSVAHTYGSLGTGTVGVGTINANAKFDDLAIS
jgi:predicted outer membrane repeat protein